MRLWIKTASMGGLFLTTLGIDSPGSFLQQGYEELRGKEIGHTTKGDWVRIENKETSLSSRFPAFSIVQSHTPKTFVGPTLLIDVTVIDTALYAWKYRLSSSIPVFGESGFGLKFGDVDNNQLSEVYGIYVSQQSEGTRVYELVDDTTWSHRHTYEHPPGIIAIAVDNIDDIDGDGLMEVYGINATTLYSFEQEAEGTLPVTPRNEFMGLSGYTIPTVLSDMKGSITKEIVYRGYREDSTGGGCQDNSIGEYNITLENFEQTWSDQLPPGCSDIYCTLNLATGDFDLDGKQEFVTSAFMGNTYVVEYVESDSFAVVWSDSLSMAGRVASGDVDGNGIEEFFVGGNQLEKDGYFHARIYAFERTADNAFEPFFEINIFPVGQFFVDLYQTTDIDRDGQDELLLSFSGMNIIIKGSGPHDYSLFYFKTVPSLRSLAAGDINGDGVAELLMSRFYLDGSGLYSHTEVYELDSTLVSVPSQLPLTVSNYRLNLNYPNPFNANTQISFDIGRAGIVELSVIDLLGRTVAVLVDEVKYPGQYYTSWDGKDGRTGRRVASGMYFLRLKWNEFNQTRKILLVQ